MVEEEHWILPDQEYEGRFGGFSAGNYGTFGFFNLVSESFSNEDIADEIKLVDGPPYQ